MKDAKGHGSEGRGGGPGRVRGMPLAGHPYHMKTNDQLRYIAKDAGEAARASRGLSAYDPNSSKRQDTEGKYLDQVNDASTVLGWRDRGGRDLSDGAAARALAGGGPKSESVPVHSGAHGRSF